MKSRSMTTILLPHKTRDSMLDRESENKPKSKVTLLIPPVDETPKAVQNKTPIVTQKSV